ncbi:hypothetical protein Sango_2089300 [Sesamum angolense]|uniref:DUF4218 domain-containing protein n=1 Tax=Sesamum angolense TaxID=2727404 RepID=A0AAE2BLZ4_9LAMI|nr:hypothetical protein Sango_2089300 [Sesamum angolense]
MASDEEGSHYRTMVMDAVGPGLIQNPMCDEQPPNPEAQKFFDLLKDVDEPLWDGPKSPGKDIDVHLRPLIDELKILWKTGVHEGSGSAREARQKRGKSKKRKFIPTRSIAMAIDLKSLNHLRVHRRSRCHNTDRGQILSWNPPSSLHTPTALDKAYGDHAPWHNHLLPYPRYSLRMHVTVMIPQVRGLIPYYRNRESQSYRSSLKRLPYDDSRESVPKASWFDCHREFLHLDHPYRKQAYKFHRGRIENNQPPISLSGEDSPGDAFIEGANGKVYKPKASYTLSKTRKKKVCSSAKSLKLPDGYSSNIARSVNEDECKFYGMKSHDSHVFMQRLLPIAFQNVLPKPIWEALTNFSIIFRDICSTVLRVEHMEQPEKNIVEILCKLEKIFPPVFFYSMEHLSIHSAYEAKVGGPMQYRWMYPFERYLDDDEMKAAHRYVLLNYDKIDPYLLKLANGLSRRVSCYKGYFVNGFKFHNVEYGQFKATTNYGVCVLGSTYSECEVDYYGLFEKIVELEYYGLERGQGENVELIVENAFQEGEASDPQHVFVANDLDGINIILDEEAEEVDLEEMVTRARTQGRGRGRGRGRERGHGRDQGTHLHIPVESEELLGVESSQVGEHEQRTSSNSLLGAPDLDLHTEVDETIAVGSGNDPIIGEPTDDVTSQNRRRGPNRGSQVPENPDKKVKGDCG